jgi:hypothetical protein
VENKIPDSPFLGSKIPDKMHFLAHLQEVNSGVTRRRNWRRRRRGSSRIENLRKKKKKQKTQQKEEEDLKRKKKQENCKVLWFLHLFAFGACVLGFLLSCAAGSFDLLLLFLQLLEKNERAPLLFVGLISFSYPIGLVEIEGIFGKGETIHHLAVVFFSPFLWGELGDLYRLGLKIIMEKNSRKPD